MRQCAEDLRESCLYRAVELPLYADASTIKKQCAKLAKKNHPDKGGEKVVFQAQAAAFRVLQNSERKAAYDEGRRRAAYDAGVRRRASAADAAVPDLYEPDEQEDFHLRSRGNSPDAAAPDGADDQPPDSEAEDGGNEADDEGAVLPDQEGSSSMDLSVS